MKNNLKRTFALIMTLVLMLSVASCASAPKDEDYYYLGLVFQKGDHGDADGGHRHKAQGAEHSQKHQFFNIDRLFHINHLKKCPGRNTPRA